MSRRFVTLLERIAEIRHLIEREESSAAPRSVRLMRLKKLQLQLAESLREMCAKQLVAMASAPSFKPRLVLRDVQSASAMSRGW